MRARQNNFPDLIVSAVLLFSFLLLFNNQPAGAEKNSAGKNDAGKNDAGKNGAEKNNALKSSPETTLRKFVFSGKTNLGRIYTYNAPADNRARIRSYRILEAMSRTIGDAKGTWSYSLGPDLGICFEPSYAFLEHPDGLRSVDANAFDCVSFPGTALLAQVSNTFPVLSRLTGICRIEVEGGEVTDEQMMPLKSLVNIECAILRGNSLTGSCFKSLSTWTKLKDIDLSYNPVKHDAYHHLAQFKMLERVHLDQCHTSDSDLKELSTLPNLKDLSIAQASLTPSGLETITNMKHLTILDLSGTKLLAKDLAKLSASSIVMLKLSPNRYLSSELIRLRKALPGKTVSIPDYSTRLPAEDQSIFAPLH